MRRAAAVLFAACCVAAGSAAAQEPWRTFGGPAAGFSIAVPRSWQAVPRSTLELNALVTRLRREKRIALANQFTEVAAARRTTQAVYRFQAFAWPAPKGVVVPDVTVKTDPLTAGATPAALFPIARQIVKTLAGSTSATASPPLRRALPAGQAVSVTGTTRLSKSLHSRFAIYLLIHRGKLYTITFRGPATAVESRIVESFGWRPR